MDVTSFEGQSYYHNSHLQGEKKSSEDDLLSESDFIIELKENENTNLGSPMSMPSQHRTPKTSETWGMV